MTSARDTLARAAVLDHAEGGRRLLAEAVSKEAADRS